MSVIELFLIGISLSMDAFAVSICKGLSVGKIKSKHMILAGLWFGGFQALMPLIGFLLGSTFEQYIVSIDHWVAFILLGVIGYNMIKESHEEEHQDASFAFKAMLVLAVATSIDALAVGVTFAFLKVDILLAVLLIGVTTFAFSAAGIKIGSVFGAKYKSKAELFGGIVLIAMGTKILIEHLFFGG
ncbi:MAG: manganese efflux pump [Oscillospiraceae bacterium]|nr:manganese efflux pump [Oscillospiraceae bacterium]MBQ3237047.1 manganese efflux pump [Oscillospiraceae bacterium]MBQ6699685.1 manganese efflux pump [Oscillospiraceae bacterium]